MRVVKLMVADLSLLLFPVAVFAIEDHDASFSTAAAGESAGQKDE